MRHRSQAAPTLVKRRNAIDYSVTALKIAVTHYTGWRNCSHLNPEHITVQRKNCGDREYMYTSIVVLWCWRHKCIQYYCTCGHYLNRNLHCSVQNSLLLFPSMFLYYLVNIAYPQLINKKTINHSDFLESSNLVGRNPPSLPPNYIAYKSAGSTSNTSKLTLNNNYI